MKRLPVNFVLVIATSVFVAGCLVPKSKYEAKVKETEELRSSYAAVSMERENLKKQVEEMVKTVDSLRADLEKTKKDLEAKNEENEKLKATVDELRNTYQTTKISRETLISELLEKEKNYSEKIKELTIENSTLKEKVTYLTRDLERVQSELAKTQGKLAERKKNETELKKTLAERTAEAESLSKRVGELEKEIHLLKGRVAHVKDEAGGFLDYASLRDESISLLSGTISSTHITRDVPVLFADIPLSLAISQDGKRISDDFAAFMGTFLEVMEKYTSVVADVIVTGKTYTGKMEVLLSLKDEEEKFLSAFSSFLKRHPSSDKVLRTVGRQTLLDKTGGKEISTTVRIYLVRNAG